MKGLVHLVGPRGSGKSAALSHLAEVLPPDLNVELFDADAPLEWAVLSAHRGLVVLAGRRRLDLPHLAAFEMAPWGDDDFIEYLLTVRKDRCASVMGRLKAASPHGFPGGVPELWSVVLDEMIELESLATAAEALRHWLAARLGDPYFRKLVTDYCLHRALAGRADDGWAEPPPCFRRVDDRVWRLVGHEPVQRILAAQRIVWDLAEGAGRDHLHKRLPPGVLAEVASLVAFREPAMGELRWVVQDRHDRAAHSAAATILHASGTGWRPEAGACKPKLCGAALGGARWAGVDLAGADLTGADLRGATLDDARLDDAAAAQAELRGASLRGASLNRLHASDVCLADAKLSSARAAGADFTSADLRGADLSGAVLKYARLVGADLRGASLRAAVLRSAVLMNTRLDCADLSSADLADARLTAVSLRSAGLSGASFRTARLQRCDLQGVEIAEANFQQADLTESDLAGSALGGANLWGAVLRGAGLADVRWEGADLRGADFTGASFHTGSSRSGLVNSVIASEGTRTGFYTDEYDAREYKPPEEIRKAALCGADLRGAKVFETDFYLVDLRGARYSSEQGTHFKRCGAILH